MGQYTTGTANVTNGSAVVAGVGTLWAANVVPGNLFALQSEKVWYEVLSVQSNTQLTLKSPYVGNTATGQLYAVHRDFTANQALPIPNYGDVGTAELMSIALFELDANLGGLTQWQPQGAYSAGTTYNKFDTVSYNGGTYVSLVAGNINQTPDATPAAWFNVFGVQGGRRNATASFTLALTDVGKTIEVNNASANTVTIPANATVAIPIGTTIVIEQQGVGVTSIAGASGVTLNSRSSMKRISAQYGRVTLEKRATNEWWAFGDLMT